MYIEFNDVQSAEAWQASVWEDYLLSFPSSVAIVNDTIIGYVNGTLAPNNTRTTRFLDAIMHPTNTTLLYNISGVPSKFAVGNIITPEAAIAAGYIL